MIRPESTILGAAFIIILVALPIAAEETGPDPSGEGDLETAYRIWTDSLVDDGTWELEMPPAREAEDLAFLQLTILESEAAKDVDQGRKAGYLVALANRTALEGDRARARSLYRTMETCRATQLRMWSVYMLAGLDFAEGQYDLAAAGYDRVCAEDSPVDWRDHACSMAGLALRLETLQLEGGDHGDPVTETP